MTSFDAKSARAKRPLPLWVDALLRDTALLEADEFGAYIKIMMAMWGSRDVAVPDDPRKLARASGVSLRLWKSRVGPALSGFWTICPEGLTQKRLREEAAYTERQVANQSNRKKPENSDKHLKNNDQASSADTSADTSVDHPTQLPNIREEGGGGSAGARADDNPPRPDVATTREEILMAMGIDQSGVTATGKIIGRSSDMLEYRRWVDDLGLDHKMILAIVGEVMDSKPDAGPPSTFTYFTKAMQRAAARRRRPALAPIETGRDHADQGHVARPSRDPHARALGSMVESWGRVIATQSGGSERPDEGG